jgi:hypothetical protein
MHTRNCPKCSKLLTYTNKYNRNSAEKKNKKCTSCVRKEVFMGEGNPFWGKRHTNETKARIKECSHKYKHSLQSKQKQSVNMTGNKNSMYGKNYYDIWVEKYGKEEADKRQALKNEKIVLPIPVQEIPCMGNLLLTVLGMDGAVGIKVGFLEV